MTKKIEIVEGQIFGFLTIIREVQRKNPKNRRFLCKCNCGTSKEVNLIHLTQGIVKSCGCFIRELNKSRTREKSTNWKGGRIIHDGYILLYNPDHSRAKTNGYVAEHILVMEKKLNRSLVKGENVHHLNGDRSDNRDENLELWSSSQPPGQRIEDKVKWAKEILKLYNNE